MSPLGRKCVKLGGSTRTGNRVEGREEDQGEINRGKPDDYLVIEVTGLNPFSRRVKEGTDFGQKEILQGLELRQRFSGRG